MNSEYQIFFFDNFIERYAKLSGKPIIYIRTYGWNNSQDVEKINESMSIWQDILPNDMFTVMKNSEFSFVEVSNLEEAVDFLETNFPTSQAEVAFPELYVHFSLCNELGQIILSN
jgi:hypothetical protein